RDEVETTARTALAALALAGIVYQRNNGYDLRSRSLLVASEPLRFEVLGRDGGAPSVFKLTDAAGLLREAVDAARKVGMGWNAKPVILKPTEKLAHLIIKSRELTAAGETEDNG